MGRSLGRLAAAIVMASVIVGLVAWFGTPSVDDVQARVEAQAAAHKVPVLAPDQVPNVLALAVVATEDERFYSHHGIDLPGLLRSMIDDARFGCLCEGGSTLTEQLMKEVYLKGSDQGLNKPVDMALAFKVESVISKPRILADWLTLAPTGPTLYGAGPAACAYFGKPLAELDLSEYALLAGLPQSPVGDEPRAHPQAALRRRGVVLDSMVSEHYITRAEADAAQAAPLLPPSAGLC
ncbi:MAG TPA: biosynthetic peptidoglycan transglycosylase [Candidatus Dormibacteraeota bacterium]|nr:biosynthetic peptidoglycan transglycosylase [Candidatus Dormibacteraeota bacterium]